jgi:hypothetical protein
VIKRPTSETAGAIVRPRRPLLFFPSSFSIPFFLIENETAVIRWDYGDPTLGTCKESILGGNHFRYWPQDGGDEDRCASSSCRVSFDNADGAFLRMNNSDLVGPFSWPFRMNSLTHVGPQSLNLPCSFLTPETRVTAFHDIIFNGYVRFLLNIPLPCVTKTELDHG